MTLHSPATEGEEKQVRTPGVEPSKQNDEPCGVEVTCCPFSSSEVWGKPGLGSCRGQAVSRTPPPTCWTPRCLPQCPLSGLLRFGSVCVFFACDFAKYSGRRDRKSWSLRTSTMLLSAKIPTGKPQGFQCHHYGKHRLQKEII